MKKRIIAVILTVLMIMAVCPVMMAEDEGTSDSEYLQLSKKVDKTADGYELTLEAYATQSVTGTPTDVVLVLDQSGSMLHAANVDKTNGLKHYESDAEGYGGLDLYIQDAMTWSQVQEQVKDPKIKEGASHPGYYMVMNTLYSSPDYGPKHPNYSEEYPNEKKIYALEYREDGKWYRYSTMGCADLEEGQVNQHIEASEEGELVRDGKPNGYFKNCIFYKSVLGVTIDAMYSFMETIEGTDNLRVAMVGFAGPRGGDDGDPDNYYTGSGFFDGDEFITIGKNFNYENTITNGDFFKATNDESGMADLWASWGEYGAKRNNTATNLGFRMAQELFDHDYTNSKANRVIVLFSDGAPSQSPDTIVERLKAGRSWDDTKDLTYIPEIYTIGPVSFHTDVENLTKWATTPEHCFQPSISGLEEAFKQIAGEIVRKTAALGDKAVLLDGVAPSFTLPSALTSVLTDNTKSDEEKTAKIKESIKVYTSEAIADKDGVISFLGEVAFNDAIIEVEKGTDDLWKVGVSNFDYTTNAVTGIPVRDPETNKDFYGKKLIVKIPIIVKPDFLGGDDVLTNTTDSGVYDKDGNLVKKFESQKVDIPLKEITPAFKDGKIYLSQEAEMPHIANVGKLVGDSIGEYDIDGINNAYVNIVYTITDMHGKSMTLEVPFETKFEEIPTLKWETESGMSFKEVLIADSTTYTVKCQVISKNKESNLKEKVDTQQIHVYKPVITFKDSEINLGEKADLAYNGPTAVKWVHILNGSVTEADTTEMGAAPTLTYKYFDKDGVEITNTAFTQDTPVRVDVFVEASKNTGLKHEVPEDKDITAYTTFYREACTFDGCDNKGEGDPVLVNKEAVDWCNFIVHIKTFSLKIVKEGNITDHEYTTGGDESQSFIFEVKKGDDHLMNVVINGTGETTITNLPVGTYTVTELENWSWRYDADHGSHNFNTAEDLGEGCVVRDGNVITVKFTNTRQNHLWLSGDSFAKNLWGSGTTGIVVNTAETTN